MNSKQQKMKLEKKEKRNVEEKNGGQKRKQEDEETPPTKRSKCKVHNCIIIEYEYTNILPYRR